MPARAGSRARCVRSPIAGSWTRRSSWRAPAGRRSPATLGDVLVMRGRLVAADSALQYAVRAHDARLARRRRHAGRAGGRSRRSRRGDAARDRARRSRTRAGRRGRPTITSRQGVRICCSSRGNAERGAERARRVRRRVRRRTRPISTRGCARASCSSTSTTRPTRRRRSRKCCATAPNDARALLGLSQRRGVLRRRAVRLPCSAARSPPTLARATRGWPRRRCTWRRRRTIRRRRRRAPRSRWTPRRCRAWSMLGAIAWLAVIRRIIARRSRRRVGSIRGRPSSTSSSPKRR